MHFDTQRPTGPGEGDTTRARAARRRRVAVLVATALATGGCGGRHVAAHGPTPSGAPHDDRAPDVFRVRLETTQGAFVIESRRAWAPRGADRFYTLVRTRVFDDARVFRVRAGFIAQFGIPGDPALAAAWRAATIPDDAVRHSNTRGTVGYAMTGPGTRTTQLFVNLADNARLDAQGFAPIGTVVDGMDVVDRLYAGYGEASGGGMRGGRQDSVFAGGNAYLDRAYPRLDHLLRARVLAPP